MHATVVREPRPIATGWQVIVRVDELDGMPVGQRAALTLDGQPPGLGTRWQMVASARPVPHGGYGQWLRTQRVVAILTPSTFTSEAAAGALSASTEVVRERVRRAATAGAGERVGGLLVGFVIGDTRLLPPDDIDAMRATSLTHLTAVSGSNVAIVAGGVLAAAILARCGLRMRWMLVGAVIVWFAYVTRLEPSVVRASTMALVLLLARWRGMAGDARHALAVAVLLLLLADPRLAGSLGLTLSASATAGVLVLAPKVLRRLERWPRRLGEVAAVTIGAQIAVLPVVMLSFGELGIASVPANVIAVPAAMVAATLGFVGSVVALASVEVGAVVFWVAAWPARVVLAAAGGLAGVGGLARWERPATIIALVAASGWLLTPPGSSRRSRRWLALAVAAVAVAMVPVVGGMLPVRDVTVTAIDVGQGDAFLVESPGARVLVDAGPDDTAARWLAAHGRRRIDLVVVTHPHLDHVGGVADVLSTVRVGELWYRPQEVALTAVDDLFTAAARRRVPVVAPQRGAVVPVGDLIVEVLHPPEGRPFRFENSELNDTSTVVRITATDGRRMLLTGDVERAGQRTMLAAGIEVAAELITVPHHGANTSEREFLAATGACVGLVSAGADNPHGHPHPEVLAMLEELAVQVYRTDLDGTRRVVVPPPGCHTSSASATAGPWSFTR
jgi:competence protein ComEC